MAKVDIIARIVPDRGSGQDLRVSLCLMPSTRDQSDSGAITLEDWPGQVSARLRGQLTLLARPRGGGPVVRVPARVSGAPATAATKVWREIFHGAEGPLFEALWRALRADQVADASAQSAPAAASYSRSHVCSYDPAPLATFVGKAWAAPATRALVALNQPGNERLADLWSASTGLVSTFHSAFFDLFGADTATDGLERAPAAPRAATAAPRLAPKLASLLGRRRADSDPGRPLTGTRPPSLSVDWEDTLADARQAWVTEQQSFEPAYAALYVGGRAVAVKADTRLARGARLSDTESLLHDLIGGDLVGVGAGPAKVDQIDAIRGSAGAKVLRETFALYHLATRRDLDGSHEKDLLEEVTPEAIARRKLAGIMAQPTLARAVGLIVDLTVPRSALSTLSTYFELALDSPDGPPDGPVWTASKLDGTYFGPAAIAEYLRAAEPLTGQPPPATDGLLDLSATVDGAPRYRLEQVDMALATEHWENAGRSRHNQTLQGDGEAADVQGPMPRDGVVGLFDTCAAHATLEEVASNQAGRKVLYLGDLTAGCRMDVGVAQDGEWPIPAKRWRSLYERGVRYEDLMADMVRDDGWFQPMARLADTGDTRTKEIVANPAMCWWSGDSQALPARGSAESEAEGAVRGRLETGAGQLVTWQSPATDLAVRATFSYPARTRDPVAGPAMGLPPARLGVRYGVGVRIALINGGGLSCEEASRTYGQGKFVLGAESFVLRRHDQISAPVVLLPPNDPVATAKSLDELRGEQLQTIVVRSGSPRPIVRFLAAPRTSLAVAASHKVLDGSSAGVPRGAYETYALHRFSGDFERLPAIPGTDVGPKPPPPSERPSRGQVLRLRDSRPEHPYYPDPLAEQCCLMFRRDGAVPPGFGRDNGGVLDPTPLIIPINPRAKWPDALALEVSVEPVAGTAERRGVMTRFGSDPDAPKVRIQLAPGETIELVAWMTPTAKYGRDEHALIPAVHALAAAIGKSGKNKAYADLAKRLAPLVTVAPEVAATPLEGAPAQAMPVASDPNVVNRSLAADRAFEAQVGRGPLPGLSAPLVLSLVHATEQPTLAPRFATLQCAPKAPAEGAKTGRQGFALVRPSLGVGAAANAWATLVRGKTACDLLELDNAAAATRAFVVGAVDLETMSTARVEVQARWAEEGPAAVRRVATSERWEWRPRRSNWQTLGSIDLPARGSGGALTELDLAFDGAGAARGLSFDFGDGRARELEVRLWAQSRYVPFFSGREPAPVGSDRFGRASVATLLHKVPATVRPPQPSLKALDVLPLFQFDPKPLEGGNGFKVVRTCLLEVRFEDWDLSGGGEMLGVVCPTTKAMEVANLDETPAGRLLSRRGHDPLFSSGVVQPWLSAADFAGSLPKETLLMPLTPFQSGVPPEATSVEVYGVRPTFDPTDGSWFHRFKLDAGQVYAPFVRLGLVRWQPNAIKDHALSSPVTLMHRVLPTRTATASFISPTRLKVVVEGQTYRETWRSPEESTANQRRAQIELRLQHLGDAGWQPSEDPLTGLPIVQVVDARDSGNAAEWSFEVALPESRLTRRYAVYLEEFGWVPGDEGETGVALVKFEQHFQCWIDLQSGLTNIASDRR